MDSHTISRIRLTRRYHVVVLCLLVILIIILWPHLRNVTFLQFDFIQFWKLSVFAVHRVDPYLQDWLIYPPWVIPLFLPFGFLSYNLSRLLWYFIQVIIIFIISDRIWAFFQGPIRYRWLAWLISLTFNPGLFALILGQLSPIILIGLFLFVKNSHEAVKNGRKWIWAGLTTYLFSLKPHILYLFWPILLLWSFQKRQWRVICTSLLIICGSSVFISLLIPNITISYIHNFFENPPESFGTPTLGYFLRRLFGDKNFWLQFIPSIIGLIFMFIYWYRRKDNWQWESEFPALVFLSLITAPYSWTHDYFLLLPWILLSFISILKENNRARIIVVIIVWLVYNLLVILMHFWIPDYWFYWQIFILLGFYLSTFRASTKSKMAYATAIEANTS